MGFRLRILQRGSIHVLHWLHLRGVTVFRPLLPGVAGFGRKVLQRVRRIPCLPQIKILFPATDTGFLAGGRAPFHQPITGHLVKFLFLCSKFFIPWQLHHLPYARR